MFVIYFFPLKVDGFKKICNKFTINPFIYNPFFILFLNFYQFSAKIKPDTGNLDKFFNVTATSNIHYVIILLIPDQDLLRILHYLLIYITDKINSKIPIGSFVQMLNSQC